MDNNKGPLLVEPAWLAEHLGDRDLVVVDCDSADAYRRGHIPGAVVVADTRFKDPDDSRFVMTPEQFAAAMTALGIDDDTLVVCYDQASTSAGRLWWALTYFGHERVRVLNGGWNQWVAEGRPVSLEPTRRTTSRPFTPRANPSVVATADQVLAAIGDPNVVIWDVRSRGEWDGTNMRGNRRQGHIPGSVHREWVHNLTSDANRRWRPADELRKELAALGITPEKEIITV